MPLALLAKISQTKSATKSALPWALYTAYAARPPDYLTLVPDLLELGCVLAISSKVKELRLVYPFQCLEHCSDDSLRHSDNRL